MKKIIALSLVCFSSFSMADMSHMNHTSDSKNESLSTQAYQKANMDMHKNMNITYSGNADVDFVKGMIAHHEGAVEMAKVQLKYGTDPELKKLSQDIITAQEKEIAFMKKWLSIHLNKH